MYTTNEEGILNNYAAEPAVYFAEYQNNSDVILSKVRCLLFVALTLVSFGVS